MSARTPAEIRAEQTLRALGLGVDAQFRAILAERDQPRFARQQEIEEAIGAFNPSANEAWEIFEALKAAISYRYQAAGEEACSKAEPFEAALLQLEGR